MKASLENLCFEMERNVENVETQVRCIGSMFSALKIEKNVEMFNRAFHCINTALIANEYNEKIMIHVLQMFFHLVQVQKIHPLLDTTDITEIVATILGEVIESSEITEMALDVISKMMPTEMFRARFSSAEFVKLLVTVARVNAKSEKVAEHIIDIARYIDPKLGLVLKKLCSSIIVLSRNFIKNETLQQNCVRAFLNIGTNEVLEAVASIALPHFVDVCEKYPNNMNIFKCLLTLTTRSPGKSCPPSMVSLILKHESVMKEDTEMLIDTLSILATKLEPKTTPHEIVPIAVAALMLLITDEKVVRMALTACFYGIANGKNKTRINLEMFQTLTSILILHAHNPSIVRRAAVVLHEVSKQTEFMAKSGAPYALLQAAAENNNDEQTVTVVISALGSFIENSQVLAGQLNRSEHVSSLNAIAEKHKSVMTIVRPVVITIRSIVLSAYNFEAFLALNPEKKVSYQITKEIGNTVLNQMPEDVAVVKSALLLMAPGDAKASTVAEAMKRFTSDKEIQICGLYHNVLDVEAINCALSLCGASCLRYVLPLIEKVQDKLPTQIIEYLLGCERSDAVDVLRAHLKRKSASLIANQFQLNFVSQIPLAMELSSMDLWQPNKTDYPVLEAAMKQSLLDPEILKGSLFFLRSFGLAPGSFSFLINTMKRYPNKSDIVSLAASFLCQFEPSDEIESIALEQNAVAIATLALKLNKKDEKTVYELLKLLHFLSFYESMDLLFSTSLTIPMLVKIETKSKECVTEICAILSNLIRADSIANCLSTSDTLSIIFKDFNRKCYQLLSDFMDQTNAKLDPEQFRTVLKQLEIKQQLDNKETFSLLNIILKCYRMDINPKKRLDFSLFTPFLTVYSTEPGIVKCVAEILPFTKDFENDSNLLFGLLEALRVNYTDIEIVLLIVILLPKFEKQKHSLSSEGSIELLTQVVHEHPRDPIVATCIFDILKGYPAAFPTAANSLPLHKDKKAVESIAGYIFSVSQSVDAIDYLPRILSAMKTHRDSAIICSYLLSSVFFTSGHDQAHVALLKNLQGIITVAVMHINNISVCRAAMGIICNLSEIAHNVAQMYICPPVVLMMMKVYPKDDQLISAACMTISNFVRCDRGGDFAQAFPSLIMALKGKGKTEVVYHAIIDLSPYVGDYCSAVADELLAHMKKENDKILPTNCLLSIAHRPGSQDAIFSKINVLFDLSQDPLNDALATTALGICAQLSDATRMKAFEPFLPNLITMVRGNRIPHALASANVCLTLARHRPDLLDKFSDTFTLIGQSKKGELSRLCYAVRNTLIGDKY